MTSIDPEYVEARRVLLDALEALAPHAPALVIAGAQAIYLRVGDGDLAVAPYTTDGDITVDPQSLAPDPTIEAAMTAAGFAPMLQGGSIEPGIWVAKAVINGRESADPGGPHRSGGLRPSGWPSRRTPRASRKQSRSTRYRTRGGTRRQRPDDGVGTRPGGRPLRVGCCRRRGRADGRQGTQASRSARQRAA